MSWMDRFEASLDRIPDWLLWVLGITCTIIIGAFFILLTTSVRVK